MTEIILKSKSSDAGVMTIRNERPGTITLQITEGLKRADLQMKQPFAEALWPILKRFAETGEIGAKKL